MSWVDLEKLHWKIKVSIRSKSIKMPTQSEVIKFVMFGSPKVIQGSFEQN